MLYTSEYIHNTSITDKDTANAYAQTSAAKIKTFSDI